MNRPPLFFRIRIVDKGRKVIGLWIPAFILLLLLLPLIVLVSIFILIADLFTLFRYRMMLLFWGVLAVFLQMTGTSVRVNDPEDDSSVLVDIN